jgi:hypothetical protein
MTDMRDPNMDTAPNTAMPTPAAPAPNATPTPVVAPTTTAAPTAPQSGTQPSDNSNAPDALTPAAKSIPANLVNNPQVPTQKMATQADDNKNSPAPQHSQLYRAAVEMTGGQRYTTSIDAAGNTVRTPISPKPWALGLALALNVLSGGLQGAAATGPGRYGKAAEIGVDAGMKQRAAVQQANALQDEQAQKDQAMKMAITKNNLEIHQMAMNVGKQDMATNQAYVDSYEPVVNMLENRPQMIKGDIPEDKIQDGLKTGKYNVTRDMFIPHGEPFPIMDTTTGQQKEVNGVPVWGHNYYIVDAKAKGVLTQEIQDQGYKIGKFRNPDGSRVNVPEDSEYPMATIGQYANQFAKIQTAEEMLEKHKADILGDEAGPRESLSDWAALDPRNMQAVSDYSRFLGAGAPDQVFGAMMAGGAGQSAQLLMQHMGVTNDDIRAAENKRLAAAAEAKAKPTAPEKIDSPDKANAVLADPNESAARKTQAKAFLKGSTATAAGKAAAEATAKTNAETNSGDVQQAARNVVSGDLTNSKDITSMRGGQRTAMFNAIHDEAVRQGKNPNDWSPAALKTKADMYEDYREGKTSNNIAAFDAFLGHANDAMDANDAWRRAGSPLINKPLTWLAKNAENDTNYTAFTTALEPVRKEFMSFLNANRAEHEGDIKTMGTVLSDASSPAQIETALKQLGKSADIRLAAIGRKYQNTMGAAFPNLISDDGKAALQRMGITSKTSAASNAPKLAPEGTIVNTPKGQMVKQGGQWVPYQGGK